jgi:SPP1 gp7 family putative phage head morphogenesis protein
MSKIEEMTFKVVDFLSKYGRFPAIKEVDERILRAEQRLQNRLLRVQAGLESEFLRALRERGYIPSTPNERLRFVSLILDIPLEEMREVIADEAVEGAELGRQMTLLDLLEQGFQIAFDSFSEEVKTILWERIYTFSKSTIERIKGDFAHTLAKGYEEGLGIDEIAKDLRVEFKNLRHYQLHRIARTEVLSAQNEGSQRTMREYGVKYKQWLTVNDSRVRGRKPKDRYDHISLHGQVVEVDEPFSNGLMYPGDKRGDKGDIINCRCRARPYIPRKNEIILTTPYYP